MTRTTIAAAALLPCMIAAACENADGPAQPDAHTASSPLAGPRWDSVPAYQATPAVRIDAGQHTLTRVSRINIINDTTIAVLQPVDGALRLFSRTGEARTSVGRLGGGPGEFRQMSGLGRVGDSIWISDITLRRITLVSSDGAIGRSFPYSAVREDSVANGAFRHLALYPDGTALVRLIRRPVKLLRVTTAGAIVEEVAQLDGSENSVVEVTNRTRNSTSTYATGVPFASTPLAAASPHGNRVLVVGTPVADAGELAVRVTAYDSQGNVRYATTLRFAPVHVPPAIADSVLERLREAPPLQMSGQADAIIAQVRERMPRYYAPVSRTVIADDGSAWLALASNGAQRIWLNLNARGEPAGYVELPGNYALLDVAGSFLCGIEEDELGLEHVLCYDVARTSAP